MINNVGPTQIVVNCVQNRFLVSRAFNKFQQFSFFFFFIALNVFVRLLSCDSLVYSFILTFLSELNELNLIIFVTGRPIIELEGCDTANTRLHR